MCATPRPATARLAGARRPAAAHCSAADQPLANTLDHNTTSDPPLPAPSCCVLSRLTLVLLPGLAALEDLKGRVAADLRGREGSRLPC